MVSLSLSCEFLLSCVGVYKCARMIWIGGLFLIFVLGCVFDGFWGYVFIVCWW